MKKSHRSAFTLIELSIVLVIIGLIAGGIMVGQKLIEGAKIRRIVSDYERYNTAVITFRNKYKQLPGDMTNASSFGLGSNGDGDKQIDYPHATLGDTPLESFYLWGHLSTAGLVEGSYSGTSTMTCFGSNACQYPGTNVPSTPFGQSTMYSFFFFPAPTTAILNANANFFIMGHTKQVYDNVWIAPVLTPLQMYQLDQKYDDGMPYTGNILNYGSIHAINCSTSTPALATATYRVIETVILRCTPIWRAPF